MTRCEEILASLFVVLALTGCATKPAEQPAQRELKPLPEVLICQYSRKTNRCKPHKQDVISPKASQPHE